MISFRLSPLLDMALSLLIIQNPKRFGNRQEGKFIFCRIQGQRIDHLATAVSLSGEGPVSPAEPLETD